MSLFESLEACNVTAGIVSFGDVISNVSVILLSAELAFMKAALACLKPASAEFCAVVTFVALLLPAPKAALA